MYSVEHALEYARERKVEYDKLRDAYLVAEPGRELTIADGKYRAAQVSYRMACIEFFEAYERDCHGTV